MDVNLTPANAATIRDLEFTQGKLLADIAGLQNQIDALKKQLAELYMIVGTLSALMQKEKPKVVFVDNDRSDWPL